MKVLVIEDAPEIVDTIQLCVSIRWPDSTVVSTPKGQEGPQLVEQVSPDIVLLDLALPDTDGLSVLQDIRRFSDVPIIIVSVRDEPLTRVKGLEMGADDYITKPFSHTELLARIKAVLRRTFKAEFGDQGSTVVGRGVTVDVARRRVFRDNEEVNLSPTEWNLLSYLLRNEGKVISHELLAERIWGSDHVTDSAIKMSIRRLRVKLGDNPRSPTIIRSYRGMGYRFELPR
jgi:DNA-binding response OmpR family regulator